MKRSEILEAARRCVCGEREQDYGTYAGPAQGGPHRHRLQP